MNSFKIEERFIGNNYKPFIIPEIGINHEGEFRKAKKMVYDAHLAGAECVKFQCHVIEDEMVPAAKKTIPANADVSIYEIMKRCSLDAIEEYDLKEYTESFGMLYLSTPFSRAASDRLDEMEVKAYKIGSGECNNYPLVEHIAKKGKPVIMSTGMNDIKQIKPSVEIFKKYNTPFALLHCTSMYPTPYEQVRLGALNDLRKAFPGAVLGLSDHSIGNYTCFGSVPLGACILEKHFTSDKSWKGPDVPISIDPKELKELIEGSNAIHQALGGSKEILPEEKPTIDFAYASVVSTMPIKKGEKFTKENLWVKRPGTGDFLAKSYDNIIGQTAKKNIKADVQIKVGHIK